jgi:hypothetical protein
MTAAIPGPDVTLEHAAHALLAADAAAWRLLNESPHVAELLAEWIEWKHMADQKDISRAVSEAADWHTIGTNWVPYATIRERRATYTTPALTPDQIRRQAAESWARVEQWIERNTT